MLLAAYPSTLSIRIVTCSGVEDIYLTKTSIVKWDSEGDKLI